jgi:hypothetical protein
MLNATVKSQPVGSPPWHWPVVGLQVSGAGQLPQSKVPHTGSIPHTRPWQSGTQASVTHSPLAVQFSPVGQDPQSKVPHTGSIPHTRPRQSGTQASETHSALALQLFPVGQEPQSKVPHTGSKPHWRLVQSGTHFCSSPPQPGAANRPAAATIRTRILM